MKIVLTPEWFLGKDVAIDIFSFVILFIFFLLCLANYKMDKKKNFVYLGGGFLLVALGQLSTILTKLVLYYDTVVTQQIGQVIVTSHILSSVDILYHVGFFLNRFFTLLGLFIIYKMLDKSKKTSDIIIITYFIILSALIGSEVYYLYHLSVALFLFLIIYKYLKIWENNKNKNTLMLIIAFFILALAHFVLMLSQIGTLFVFGNILELISYIILLFLIIKILRPGDR